MEVMKVNTLEACSIVNPAGKTDECAKFVIADAFYPFVLHGISTKDQRYTFSCWAKSESVGALTIGGTTAPTSDTWTKISVLFVADSADVDISFDTVGTYYIYHPKLEIGTLATDWSPALEDVEDRFAGNEQEIEENKKKTDGNTERVSVVEASLKILEDSVVTRVADEDGNTTVLTQAGTGWVFSMSDLEKSVSDALAAIAALSENQQKALSAIETLEGSVSDHGKLTDYITLGEFEGQPCIELGEVGGDFKLRITNTKLYFIVGSAIRTTITNQKMIADKIEVTQEYQQGGFVSLLHGEGNLGVLWKGVSS
jgi:hypothetical protein